MVADLTLGKILALAAADAVNPCALAVLTLVLISILTYNPKKKHSVLLSGLMFTLAVYILYLIYGLVIIQFFKAFVNAISIFQDYLYKGLALFAILLGLLNIKDAIWYKAGGFMTEMPMFLRPKVKNLIEGITSPKGAFLIGVFVTLFLLPCTIGPYLIASGILSTLDILRTLPWLLLYNLIFVLPMLGITTLIYIGYTTVENVSGWKEANIRWLHLIAGSLLALLGSAMILGWV